MPLSVGDKLGRYEILCLLGKGGMGEVYKARDSRLNRDVAIKVSKAEFSERFEREARAVAALNHSHICTLHDVGPNYLVMEYIEGTPLKGPLPLDQALKYAVQICDALAAAHKKGITHRDLKPANILVTKAGVKLLDFGLAKFAHAAPATPPAGTPDDATLTMALTGKNEILGTLYYMSPEQLQAQANGQEIDGRSDIFSFGLVLYEMLTGKRAFEGSSPASVIAAIMERPAPSIAAVAPPALDRVLQKCLAKDPDERWQTARDLKDELAWVANASGEATTVPTPVARHRLLPWIAAAAVLAIAAAIGLSGWYRATRPAELKPLVRLDVDLGSEAAAPGWTVILSPDGSRIVYRSQGKLFTRRLDQPQATELPGTTGAANPFLSPDGKWVAFFITGKLSKIAVEGGLPVELCQAPFGRGGSWGEDGSIVAALGYPRSGLSQIPAGGGAPAPLTELQPGEATHALPQILPGGKAVLFTASGEAGEKIEVVSLVDHKIKTLQDGGNSGRFLGASGGPGYLVYFRNRTLLAAPFDLDQLAVRGTPTPVLEGVATRTSFGVRGGAFDVAPTGTLVYRTGGAAGNLLGSLQWLDSAGKMEPLIVKPGLYSRPRFSPDGQRLAFEMRQGASVEVWVHDLPRKATTQLTFDGNGLPFRGPVWTRDGRYLLFSGRGGLYWIRADGAGKPQALTQSKNLQVPYSFTPDGRRLSWDELDSTGFRVWTMEVTNTGDGLRGGKAEVFFQTTDAHAPTFSPDGRWIAYFSNESGVAQAYVRAFPDNGGKWQVSVDGGVFPRWARNGRELFFAFAGDIMVATYTAKGDSFVADPPKRWSSFAVASDVFDVAPDGKRVVAAVPVETLDAQRAQSHVVFLLNFYDELRRKVPVSK